MMNCPAAMRGQLIDIVKKGFVSRPRSGSARSEAAVLLGP
jgi:hypothetical protein